MHTLKGMLVQSSSEKAESLANFLLVEEGDGMDKSRSENLGLYLEDTGELQGFSS